jgi:integrase
MVHQFLDGLGVRAADLQACLTLPTIGEFLPRVIAMASPGMRRTYGPYWTRAKEHFGARTLDELRPTDIGAFRQHAIATACRRRNSRDGRYAGENAVRAMRAIYRLAVADGLIRKEHNPAISVTVPRRTRSTRRGLSREEVADLDRVIRSCGNDPALDSLLLRLHLETACRRSGALGLRVKDLDTTYCRVLLREKGGTQRWQPITPTLAAALADHAQRRNAHEPNDTLLRYRNGRPLTARRYDGLWKRVRSQLPWAGQLGISTHWLRHTALTWVEREFGYAIAHSYAGHHHDKGTTLIYTRGRDCEVAAALAWLTNEPHPLAGGDRVA